MSSFLSKFFPSSSPEAKQLRRAVYTITTCKPHNLALYQLAFQHGSLQDTTYSNERLEFLGDAVLSLIIGEYLFKKYPLKEEGFLTEIRARIVNRASLGKLAKQLGLDELLQYNSTAIPKGSFRFAYGNALEALIGAVYLDRGYKRCCKFVIDRLLKCYIDLECLIAKDTNYKSQLVVWANKNHKKVQFKIVSETNVSGFKEFTAHVFVEETMAGQGQGRSKKEAEQQAAYKALEVLATNSASC